MDGKRDSSSDARSGTTATTEAFAKDAIASERITLIHRGDNDAAAIVGRRCRSLGLVFVVLVVIVEDEIGISFFLLKTTLLSLAFWPGSIERILLRWFSWIQNCCSFLLIPLESQ